MKSKWTGERLETFIYNRDTVDHLHRYAIASNFIEGKIVLDIASGEGYGSNLMSKKASFVYGVDIDDKAIKNADQKYKKQNLKFLTGSTSAIPISRASVDVVVSFETIEHHDKHQEMMLEIKRVLKPNGILIISTPDRLYYSDKRGFKNEFHIKELYKNEFVELLSNSFQNIQLLAQEYSNGNSIVFNDNAKMEFYTGEYSQIQKSESFPLYLIAIASNVYFQEQKDSIFDGSDILKIEHTNKNAVIYQSNSYKLGHFILSPLKFIKKKLK